MALRFKNDGDGTTAEGAILAANPDEFQEALNYSIINDFTHTTKYIELEADLDLNYSATWYYRMTDIFNVNGINLAGNTLSTVVVNGNGHSITNIFVFPNCAVFGAIKGMGNTTQTNGYAMLELNDITFEAILQKGAGFFAHANRQSGPDMPSYYRSLIPLTNGCIFNVKVDNSLNNTNGNMIFPFNYDKYVNSSTVKFFPKAVNCIFNIYISAAANDYNSLFAVNTASPTDYSQMTIFESCEFRIRNNTDKRISIFRNFVNASYVYKFLIDNCSFFLADIKQYDDPDQRTTSYGSVSQDTMHLLGYMSNSNKLPRCMFYNSFIAAFGDDFNSGSNDPIYVNVLNNTSAYEFTTSFYDKSKVRFCDGNTDAPFETTGLTALTTEQCKDKTTLSSIGYLFAEEV